jgi:predicted metal-dependent phosphoesterase TrpH
VSRVDLHIHSTASDGRFSPEEIVAKAARQGLTVIAITDHDTVSGIAPAQAAASAFPALRLIPGVELSADFSSGEVHVLGYFIDINHEGLKLELEKMRGSRNERALAMIEKMADLGVYIEWSRVKELAGGGSVGRPHLARAMLERGYVASIGEAFSKYIGRDGLAYVRRRKVTPAEAVELILRSDGLPVLAHPLFIEDWRRLALELKGAGLVGIETYYNGYTASEVDGLRTFAGKYGLIATGGSDFHGIDPDTETFLGGVEIPMESADHLLALAKERALRSGGMLRTEAV